MTAVGVALMGGLGALARFEVGFRLQHAAPGDRPWGTAAVNLSGAVALGVLAGLAGSGAVGSGWVRITGGGFLGGFTTFSTWMVESANLARRSGWVAAAVNLVGMVAVGVLGAGVGLALGRRL